MSGPMTPALANAAMGHALRAKAEAAGLTVGRFVQREALKKLETREGESGRLENLPSRTWRAMGLRTRTVLVMLASSDCAGDPRTYAAQPWGSLSVGDQCAIAACARELGRDLCGAVCLS